MQAAYYHGTDPKAARAIAREGFRVWFDVPEIGRFPSGGNLGTGVYLAQDWRIALWFGPSLLRVELRPGTKLFDASLPPDPRALDALRREFGREILEQAPWKALPRNKRLALPELAALARHHYHQAYEKGSIFGDGPRAKRQSAAMRQLSHYRSMLVRYGFHGYGNASNHNGIVVFAEDRIASARIVAALPPAAYDEALGADFALYPSIEYVEKAFPPARP